MSPYINKPVLVHLKITTLVSVLVVASCESGPEHQRPLPFHSTSDSAGATIVSSDAPAWRDTPWKLSTDPVLEIGAVAGDSAYQFHSAHTALRLSDGRIVVANMGTNQLRYYDAGGKFLMVSGRRGQGPGEWDQLYQVRRVGKDSLHVIDPPNTHSLIAPTGQFLERFSLDPVAGRPNIWALGATSSGHVLAYSLRAAGPTPSVATSSGSGGADAPRSAASPQSGFYREEYQHFVYSDSGRMVDSIGLLPGRARHGNSRANATFLAQGHYHVHANKLYFAPGDKHEVHVYRISLPGENPARSYASSMASPARASMVLELVMRRVPDRPLEVTQSVIDARKAEERKVLEERKEFLRNRGSALQINVEEELARLVFPAMLPAQARIMVDAEGHVWEQRYNLPSDSVDTFAVYGRDGVWLGLLSVPPRFRVTDVGSDYVLGIWRNDADVQFVRMYSLIK